MIKQKTKIFCLFLTIMIIFLATVSATDTTEQTNTTTKITENPIKTSQNNIVKQEQTEYETDLNIEKEINDENSLNETKKTITKKNIQNSEVKTATTFQQVYATRRGDAADNGQNINNPTTFYHALQIVGQNGVIKFVNRDEDVTYEFKSPISINPVVLSQGTTKFTITVSDPDSGHKLTFDGLNESQLFVIEDGYDIKFQSVNFADTNTTGEKGTENGGAIFSINSNVTFQSCNFTNTHAVGNGGAIFLSGGTVNFAWDNVFTNCSSEANGGALFLAGTGYTKLHNLTFENCSSELNGGSIFGTGVYIDMDMNNLINSSSGVDGGSLYVNGDLKIFNTNVKNTYAQRDGGLIHIENGTLYFGLLDLVDNHAGRDGGSVYAHNVTFDHTSNIHLYNNSAGRDGGVIYFDNVTTTRSVVTEAYNNSAGRYGGVYYVANTNFTVQNLKSNLSNATYGGVLYTLNSTVNMQTADIYNSNATLDGGTVYCENTTFISNSNYRTINTTAVNGGAMYFLNSNARVSNGASFTNSVAKENGGMIYCDNTTYYSSGYVPYVNGSAGKNGGAIYATSNSSVSLNETPLNTNIAGENGGAVYVNESSLYVHINANDGVSKNIASNGGAIYAVKSNVTLNSSGINNNQATSNEENSGLGGGLYADDCIINITGAPTIRNNTATNGGGLYIINSNASIAASIISNNATNKSEDLLNKSGLGGGLYTAYSNISFVGSDQFTSNTASDGGAIYAYYSDISGFTGMGGAHNVSRNGGLVYLSYSNLTLQNNGFSGGFAGANGGSYYVDNGKLYLLNVSLSNNRAGENGGAIYSVNGTVELGYSSAISNNANKSGGFIYAVGENNNITINNFNIAMNNANETGGAIYNSEGNLTLDAVSLLRNTANQTGGAIYNNGTLTASKINFTANQADIGGAVYNDENGNSTMEGVSFEHNSAVTGAGAIYSTGNVTIFDSSILTSYTKGNATAVLNDGYLNLTGVYIAGNYPELEEGATGYGTLYNTENGTIILNSFGASDNGNTYGGFIYNEGTVNASYGGISENQGNLLGGAIYNNNGGNITIEYSSINDNIAGWGNAGQIYNNNSNIVISYSFVGNDSQMNYWSEDDYSAIVNENNGNITFIQSSVANNSHRAILNLENSTVILDNSNIFDNNATNGAGIYNKGLLIIDNSTQLHENIAKADGGAIYNYGTGITQINNSYIYNNSATNGGAINNRGNLTIKESEFINNTATENGGAINEGPSTDFIDGPVNYQTNTNIKNSLFKDNTASNGGAISEDTSNQWNGATENYLNIENTTFTNNSATNGGTIYEKYNVWEGITADTITTIKDSTFSENTATNGGAIYEDLSANWLTDNNSKIIIDNTTFINNNATENGGAIGTYTEYANPISMDIINSNISNNNATNGGAIFNDILLTIKSTIIDNNTATSNGGAIYTDSKGVTHIVNSNLTNNYALDGGLIYNKGSLNLSDSYVANNTAGNADNKNYVIVDYGEGDTFFIVTGNYFYNNTANYDGDYRDMLMESYRSDKTNILVNNNQYYDNYLETSFVNIYIDEDNMLLFSTMKLRDIYNDTVVSGDVLTNITPDGETSVKVSEHSPEEYSVSILNLSQLIAEGNIDIEDLYDAMYSLFYTTYNVETESYNKNYQNSTIEDVTLLKSQKSYIIIDANDTIVLNNSLINGTLINEDSDGIANSRVNLTFNNGTFSVIVITDEEGKFSYLFPTNVTVVNNVTAVFKGNGAYTTSSNETTFNVAPRNTTVTVSATEVTVGEDTIISGELHDQYGITISNADINITVNNGTHTVVIPTKTDDEGKYSVNYSTVYGGVNNITVDYYGNNTYNPSRNDTTFIVNKKNTDISLSAEDVKVRENTTITGRLTDEEGNGIPDANITIVVNNVTVIPTVTDKEGNYNVNYTTITSGVNNITVKYEGNDTFNPSNNTATFNVDKIKTTIILDEPDDTLFNTDTMIYGILIDEYNKPVPFADVTVTLPNGSNVNVKTDKNGKFNVTVKNSIPGEVSVTAVYEGNNTYHGSDAITNYTVNPIDTNINIEATSPVKITKNTTISGVLSDANGNSIAFANITVTINGQPFNKTTDTDGKYEFNVTTSMVGTNYLTVDYAGNASYKSSHNTSTFEVVPLDTITSLSKIPDVLPGTSVIIDGELKDEFGNLMPNANIIIVVDDNTLISAKTDDDGRYSTTYTPTSTGSLTVMTLFAGNSTHNPSNNVTRFTVKKIVTDITINPVDNTTVNNITTITGKLTDEEGKPLPNTNVTVTLPDGSNVTTKTDSNGEYNVEINNNITGDVSVKVEFNGNSTHEASSSSVTFNVRKFNAVISIVATSPVKITKNTTISGVLKDENGKVISDAVLIVGVDDIQFNVKTDENGNYKLDYTADNLDKAFVTVWFNGDNTYNGTFNKTTFNVLALNTTTTVNKINDTTPGSTVTISGNVKDEFGRPLNNAEISIIINEKEIINTTTNNNGQYTIIYNNTQNEEHKSIVPVYLGNSTHLSSYDSTGFNINKINSQITITTPNNVTVGKPISITGKLTDHDGKVINNKNIEININDAKITVTTDENGNYNASYTPTNTGVLPITVSYPGDNTYNNAFNKTTFNVLALNTTTTVNKINDTTPGSTVTISGNVKDEFGRPLNNAEISIIINEKEIINTTTNNNGQYTIIYNNTQNEEHKSIVPVYLGNSTHLSSYDSTGFNISKINSQITITTPNNVTTGKPMNITGKLTDSDGKGIANKNVIITVNGTQITVTTDENGNYNTSYTPTNTGVLPITVSYPGDNVYNPSDSNAKTINVKRMNTSISMNPIKDTTAGNKTNITGKLTDEDGKPLSNVDVSVTLPDGSIVTTRTDKNGVYNLVIDNNVTGTVKVIAEVNGNSSHAPSSIEVSYNVKKRATIVKVEPIVGTVGENITLIASVTDEYGNPVTGGNLVFKLNGITLKSDGRFDTNNAPLKLHVENGKVTFTITADLYLRNIKNITASYSGSSIYSENKSDVSEAQIRLRYMNINVKVSPSVAKQYQTVTFTATVSDVTKNAVNKTIINQDAYVIFKINGNSLKDKNGNVIYTKVVNNKATFNYTIPRGTAGLWTGTLNNRNYDVEVVYSNANFYPVNNKNSTSYGVERSPVTVSFKEVKIVNNYLSVKADLKDFKDNNVLGTNKICLKINGKTYTVNNDTMYYYVKDGVVTITGIYVNNPSKITSVGIVTGDREAYLSSRGTTTKIVKS